MIIYIYNIYIYVCVCIYKYIHTYIHACMHTYLHTYISFGNNVVAWCANSFLFVQLENISLIYDSTSGWSWVIFQLQIRQAHGPRARLGDSELGKRHHGRNPAITTWDEKTIVNHGVKYISTCTGFLSSTCSLMMFFIGSLMEVEFFWLLLRPWRLLRSEGWKIPHGFGAQWKSRGDRKMRCFGVWNIASTTKQQRNQRNWWAFKFFNETLGSMRVLLMVTVYIYIHIYIYYRIISTYTLSYYDIWYLGV